VSTTLIVSIFTVSFFTVLATESFNTGEVEQLGVTIKAIATNNVTNKIEMILFIPLLS